MIETHSRRSPRVAFARGLMAVLVLALPPVAAAASPEVTGLLAVLPLDTTNAKKISQADRVSLEESIRTTAGKTLTPLGLRVLTGDTTLSILADNNIDPSRACEASCAMEAARELKAGYFVSGTIATSEDRHLAFIRLFESRTGAQVGAIRLKGRSVSDLLDQFDAQAAELFAALLSQRGATEAPEVKGNKAKVETGTITAAVGKLTVATRPQEGVRLELTDPSGKSIAAASPFETANAKPGQWKVVARAQGYEEQTKAFDVPPDDITLVKLELAKLGELSVTGEPAGAALLITGPGGFREEGGLPWKASGLVSGQYLVQAARAGYVDAKEVVEVSPGQSAKVHLTLRRATNEAAAAEAKELNDGYDLSSPQVLPKVISLAKESYFDPARVKPREMVVAALESVARERASVTVEGKAGDGRVRLTCGGATRELRFDGGDNTFDQVALWLRPAFAFLQENLPANANRHNVEYAAINGMFSVLDPHTLIVTPKVYAEMKVSTQGEFGGLGIVVAIEDARLTVRRPLKNTPASRAGLMKKDLIVRIDGESTTGMPLDVAVGKLRGKLGTEVVLSIVRGSEKPRDVRLTRATIVAETVTDQLLGDGVGYLRISSFSAKTATMTAAAIERLKEQAGGKLKGLVLDLRSNPGGLLEQATQVADQFLDTGTLVTTVGKAGKLKERREAHAGGELELPMAVLINAETASGAEICAGALRNLNRVVTLGQRSFGKSTVQVLNELTEPVSGQSLALKLTIAEYLVPGDKSIQGVGLSPDIELVPARVSRERLRLHAPLWARREGGVELSTPASAEPPQATLRVLQDELADDADPDLATDGQVRLAAALLRAAPRSERRAVLSAATSSGFLGTAQAEAEAKIADALTTLGLDWSESSQGTTATPSVSAQLKTVSEPVFGGDRLTLTVDVTNTGKAPIERLRAFTRCGAADPTPPAFCQLVDRREFVFGRLAPGAKRTWSTAVIVPSSVEKAPQQVVLEIGAAHSAGPKAETFTVP